MGWSWCLPTGFNTPLTYYYVIYFAILLAHRQSRDDEACKRKCVLILTSCYCASVLIMSSTGTETTGQNTASECAAKLFRASTEETNDQTENNAFTLCLRL